MTNSIANDQTLAWQQFNFLFTATSSSTTLAFINGDPSNDNSNGIDNIVVTPVPEPATGLLVMVGMLGLAVARRRAGMTG